jgi:hypothetical protein
MFILIIIKHLIMRKIEHIGIAVKDLKFQINFRKAFGARLINLKVESEGRLLFLKWTK